VASKNLPEQLFLQAPRAAKNGRFSPDRKWVACASYLSGEWEIHVTSLQDADGTWQVSNEGGDQRPGGEAEARNCSTSPRTGKSRQYPSKDGAHFSSGAPPALFQADQRAPAATSGQAAFDVTQDDQRFLITTHVQNGETQPMTFVLNWGGELRKK